MGIFFFYNNRKPRRFNYTPILYDPEKEERQERLNKRIAQIKREMGVSAEEEPSAKKDLKGEFLSQTTHLKKRKEREASGKKPIFTSNSFLFFILIVLVALFVYWILR